MEGTTRVCPQCGHHNLPGSRFCSGCATPLALVCPSCGAENAPGSRFCNQCATALVPAETRAPIAGSTAPAPAPPAATAEPPAAPEERRLVTALFCDLAGFTPLSESLDPEDVRDIQADYFSAMSRQIERYAGVVEKYAGDAVLALFGVPVAHEDDAERAVLCALGMQAAIEPVAATARARWNVEPSIRVGVNTGEVVSGTWNASGRQDVAVTGDAVNTAARLQSAADPGEVLVGAETMRLTRRRIQYGERRDLTLKGKSGAIPVWPALGTRDQVGERWEGYETPLVGRERELATLREAWGQAQAGNGQLLTVAGDAGVGKSRLVDHFLSGITSSPLVRVVRARSLSYGQEVSLWLIADLLRSLFGIREQAPPEEAGRKLQLAVHGMLHECDAETRADAVDVLGEVLGIRTQGSLLSNAGAEIRRQVLIRALHLVVGALSQRTSAIILLEDLHWIDQASAEIVRELLLDVPGLRLLVLVTQRPGWTAPWSEWGWPERITLRPLGDAEAALLAGAVLGGVRLSSELERYVAERAGGNPFFVEEMLRALDESGGLVERDGEMCLAPGAGERLPATLTEVLLARLDRLEQQVRSVAQVGSVIGRSFAVQLLATVLEREQAALEMPLTALQQAEIAFPRHAPDLEYVFKHVSMRDVAYNTLVSKRRQALHLQTARAIASLYPADEYAEMIAYHYARTDEDAEAAVWLERAGDRAAAVYANERAVGSYQAARTRLERSGADAASLARLDEKLGKLLLIQERATEAQEALERAVAAYRSIGDLDGIARAAGELAITIGETPALELLEKTIAEVEWAGPSAGLASLWSHVSITSFSIGRYPESLAAAERAIELARAVADDRAMVMAYVARLTSGMQIGGPAQALQAAQHGIPLAEELGEVEFLTILLNNAAFVSLLSGHMAESLASLERNSDLASRTGVKWQSAFGEFSLAETFTYLGNWERAAVCLKRAGDLFASMEPSPRVQWSAGYIPLALAWLDLWSGRWEVVEEPLRRAIHLWEESGDLQGLQVAGWSLGELLVRTGRAAEARELLEPIVSQHGNYVLAAAVTLAWAHLELGDADAAGATLESALERMRARNILLFQPDALRVQGMIAHAHRCDEAAHSFSEAVSLARSFPYPYAEARALAEWGKMLLSQGDQVAGQERLQEALAIFQRLGANKDVEGLHKTTAP